MPAAKDTRRGARLMGVCAREQRARRSRRPRAAPCFPCRREAAISHSQCQRSELRSSRIEHQEQERRGESFGMELVQRDKSRGGRDQHRAGQEQRGLAIETEPLSDIERHWAHRGERSVLDDDEDQSGAGKRRRAVQSGRRSVPHDCRATGHAERIARTGRG